MWRFIIGIGLATTAWLTLAGTGSAAGFDCSKASSPDEVAVCRNPQLSALDSEMTGLWYGYSRVPMLMGGNGERQTEADEFLVRRRQCGRDVSCLARAYVDRIAELRRDVAASMQSMQPCITGASAP